MRNDSRQNEILITMKDQNEKLIEELNQEDLIIIKGGNVAAGNSDCPKDILGVPRPITACDNLS